MNKNEIDRYKRIACYFSKEEGKFIQKMADKESLKVGHFVKKILISEFKKMDDPLKNPFCKSEEEW